MPEKAWRKWPKRRGLRQSVRAKHMGYSFWPVVRIVVYFGRARPLPELYSIASCVRQQRLRYGPRVKTLLRKHGLQLGPDVVEDPRLGVRGGMDAIRLHQGRLQRDTVEYERHHRYAVSLDEAGIDRVETLCVLGAVIWRDANSGQQDLGPSVSRPLDDRLQIPLHLPDRSAAQTVIAAELDDDDCRLMQLEGTRQAGQRGTRRITADAGIHHLVTVTFRFQARLQQTHPSAIERDTEGGTQTVAEDQDTRAVGECLRQRCDDQRNNEQGSMHD